MKRLLLLTLIAAAPLMAEKLAVIEVSGMSCPLCTVAVKRSLKHTPGVHHAKVRLNTRKATVRFADDLNTSRLLEAIRAAGGYEGKILSVTDAAAPRP